MMTKEKMDEIRRRIDEMREACRLALAGEEARRKGEGVRDRG